MHDPLIYESPWLGFLLFIFATIGIHRIWHWENITAFIRQKLRSAIWTPIICPSCSPIWITSVLVALAFFLPWWVFIPFACYPFVWWMNAVYKLLPTTQDRIREAIQSVFSQSRGPSSPCPCEQQKG